MRILNDTGYIGINANPSYGNVTVLVSGEDGVGILTFDVDQCNEIIAAMTEARNAVIHAKGGRDDKD